MAGEGRPEMSDAKEESKTRNLEPEDVQIRPGGCTVRHDTLGPSRWRKPIRAGGVKLTQAS